LDLLNIQSLIDNGNNNGALRNGANAAMGY